MTLIELKEAATKAAWPPAGAMPEDLSAWEKASYEFTDNENLAEDVLALIQALEVAERAMKTSRDIAAGWNSLETNRDFRRIKVTCDAALSHIKTLTGEKT